MNPVGKFLGKYKPDFDEEQVIHELKETPLLVYTHNCMGPLSVSISPEPLCLVAGSSDGYIRFLNEEGRLEWTYRAEGYVWGVGGVGPSDGRLVAAGSSGGRTYLLNSQGEMLWEYFVGATAYNVSMSSHGQYIAVSADNQGVYLFNDEGELLWNEQMEDVRGISLSLDGNKIAAVQAIKGWKEKISLYENKTTKNSEKPQKKWGYKVEDYMWGTAVSPDGSYIVAGSSDGHIYFFNHKGKLLWTYRTEGYVWGVSVSSDGKLIVAGSSDGHIYLLNIKGDLLWGYKTSGDVMDVSIASDGSYMAAASLDMNVYLFGIPVY